MYIRKLLLEFTSLYLNRFTGVITYVEDSLHVAMFH